MAAVLFDPAVCFPPDTLVNALIVYYMSPVLIFPLQLLLDEALCSLPVNAKPTLFDRALRPFLFSFMSRPLTIRFSVIWASVCLFYKISLHPLFKIIDYTISLTSGDSHGPNNHSPSHFISIDMGSHYRFYYGDKQ